MLGQDPQNWHVVKVCGEGSGCAGDLYLKKRNVCDLQQSSFLIPVSSLLSHIGKILIWIRQ